MSRRTLFALALTAVTLQLAACQLMTGPNPGEGSQDRETRRKAEPVIVALEQFRRDRGHYPKRIQELVPRYIADGSALGVGSFSYTVRGFGYRLGGNADVAGIPPLHGVNQCEDHSRKKRMECSGYM